MATYYLRSSVLGGQVVAEMNGSGVSQRGYVYLGGQTIAVQQQNAFYWMHEDPVAKSKRVTDSAGTVVSTIELDPWGGETNRSSNEAFQPKKFTTYERDVNGSDEAMHRRITVGGRASTSLILTTAVTHFPILSRSIVLATSRPLRLRRNGRSEEG